MEPCRSLALLAGSLGLTSSLIALSTDFWIVATGPKFSSHSGLWPTTHGIQVAGKVQWALWGGNVQWGTDTHESHLALGYIHVTQSFCILAALWSLVSMVFLILSYSPALSVPGRGPLVSTVMSFAAGMNESGTHWDPRAGESCSGQASSLLFLSSALSVIVAMAVYTSSRWSQTPSPQVQTSFAWSFYLGWVSSVLFLCAGNTSPGKTGVWGRRTLLGCGAGQCRTLKYLLSPPPSLSTLGCLSLGAHCRTHRAGYETL